MAEPLLRKQFVEAADNSPQKLRLSLGLLASDPDQVVYLSGQLLQAEPEDFCVIRDFLVDHANRFVPQLWQVLADQQDGDKRLHAAAALASYDPTNPLWETIREPVAANLCAIPVSFLREWKEAFRPVAHSLLEPLTEIFRDEQQDGLARSLAATMLADYAGHDPAKLANLISIANDKQFGVLFPILKKHAADAVHELDTILEQRVESKWNDAPFDPAWEPVPDSVANAITAAQGTVAARFAYCLTMPLQPCVKTIELLRPSGYRPVHFRPYALNGKVQVAAVWTRDQKGWQIHYDLTAEQLQDRDLDLRQQGLIPVDVAGYLESDSAGQPANRFAAIWADQEEEEAVEGGEVRIYAGIPASVEPMLYVQPWSDEGFSTRSLSIFVGQDSAEYRSAIWSKQKDQAESTSAIFDGIESNFTGDIYPGLLLSDVQISRPATPLDRQQQYREQLAALESQLAERGEDTGFRKALATVRFQLGQDERALEDLNWLIEKLPKDARLYQLRCMVHARAERGEEAREDLARYQELYKDETQHLYLEAVVRAHLGEDVEGMQQLEEALRKAPGNASLLYNAACAYALVVDVFATTDAPKSEGYAERALTLLDQAFAAGYDKFAHIQQDKDLDAIRGDARFVELMGSGMPDYRCVAVWNASTERVSTELHGLTLEDHKRHCQRLIADGYRPVAMSAESSTHDASLVTASVWHRPRVSATEREMLGKRQAQAAVALLGMGQTKMVWPMLAHSPAPGTRSYLIHDLSPLDADSQAVVERLSIETDESARRALVLALGGFNHQQLPPAKRDQLAAGLLATLADAPDAGTHAAAEWVLRRWGKHEQITEQTRALATGKPEGDRRWYINKQGQTLALVPGPSEFLMGSPIDEPGREGGPLNRMELLHRKRIGRSFALMTHEVTVDQFLKFKPDMVLAKEYAREGDAPMTRVTWYLAAEYCNWLSEQERHPRGPVVLSPQ